MKSAPSEQVLFAEAQQLASPEARAVYLESACGADVPLRRRVEALLEAAEAAGEFLEQPPTELRGDDLPTSLAAELTEKPGDRIGRYKLLEKIGEGGCGVVYMAEQEEPVRRRVALKIIKLGMDTRQVIARFEAERQALALMDHPHIAKVLDGGATPTGRPYFVMELVRGSRITEYCDAARLSNSERLELFVQVCQAVQHAHQKGIIHRDLKPSNILVTVNDGVAVPKVIDFGIAKATGQKLTDKTLITQFHAFLGTPAYTSPEQAEMSSVDIDTRSDIYSLGVLLYELLTGRPPFDGEQLLSAGLDEMRRIIRQVEPPRPSTRLSTLDAAELTALGARRKSHVPEMARTLRGDLDWIVMKCLEKDRSRRYETASGLAADIKRHLNSEPVSASPPSAAYRFQKLVHRNKLAFAAGAAVALTLVCGIVASSWQALRATRAMRAALIEKQRADQEAATAKRVTDSLQQMFGLIDPDAASRSIMSLSAVRLQVLLGLIQPKANRGLNYTIEQLIDDFAENLEGKLADQPAAAAELHATVGRAYACRGYRDKARKHLERALALGRSVYGEQHENYADLLVDYSRPDGSDPAQRPEREADIRQALAIYRARGVSGERVIRALWMLEWNLKEQALGGAPAKWALVEPVLNEALAEAAKAPGVEYPKIASIYSAMSGVKMRNSQFAEAESIARQALAMHLKMNPDSSETAWCYFDLAAALTKQGKFAEALAAEKPALVMMRNIFQPENVNIRIVSKAMVETLAEADAAHALAGVFPSAAELGELEAVFGELLAVAKDAKFDNDHPVRLAIGNLTRFSEFYLGLGHELASAGKLKQAEECRAKAMQLLENLRDQFAGSPGLLPCVVSFGAVAMMKAGEPQKARELFRKLLDQQTPATWELQNDAAWFLATSEIAAQRDPTLAIELATKAVESNPQTSGYHNTLGVARYRARDWQQAITELEKSISLSKGGDGFDYFFLSMAHWQLGNKDQAHKWLVQAVAWMDKKAPDNEELRRFRSEAEKLIHE